MEWPVWFHTEVKQLGGGYEKGTLTVEPTGARLERNDGGTIENALRAAEGAAAPPPPPPPA
jgi:hypothetical protein